MAKDENKEKGSKGPLALIVILIVITWLSVMALLIKCDVGGFGSEVLRPVFKDVPVIKAILPDASNEEVARESDYPYDNLADALAQIEIMDGTIAAKDAEILALNDKVAELSSEVDRLKVFEDEQNTLEEQKNKFYSEIVYGEMAPDTDTYIEWYNSIDSEHAEAIYREIIEAKEADQEIKDLAATFEGMKADKAADVLESMGNDLDTVALIMNNMSSSARAKVLEAMEPEFAASVTKKLLP